MNWIENVLIIAGVSLDIFAAMECQGAFTPRIWWESSWTEPQES